MTFLIIEKLLLDQRHFLDDTLTFIEFYEASQREQDIKFLTNNEEICKLKQSLKKFSNTTNELKTQLNYSFIHEFNSSIEYSSNFKRKISYFFNTIFKRLYALEFNLKTIEKKNEILTACFKSIQKLIQKINDFINYLESKRWHKSIANEILNNIFCFSLKLSKVLDKFFDYLNYRKQISSENFYRNQKHSSTLQKKNNLRKFGSYLLSSSKSKLSEIIFDKKIYSTKMISLVFLFVAAILVIILGSWISQNSKIYTIDLNKAYRSNNYFSDLINNKVNLLSDVSLSNFLNIFCNPKIDASLRTNNIWDQILSYMKEFYVVFISFTAFLSLEFFVK